MNPFFEMYGMYEPTVDTLESFKQQIEDNQEGTRFDHWYILSVPNKATLKRAIGNSTVQSTDDDNNAPDIKRNKIVSTTTVTNDQYQ